MAKQSAGKIAEAQRQIARATDQLIEADLLDPQAEDDQPCPVCEDGTLTPDRVREIVSWGPLARAVEEARSRRSTAAVKVGQELDRLKQAAWSAAPEPIEEGQMEGQLESLPQRAGDLGRAALSSATRLRERAAVVAATADGVHSLLRREEATAEVVEATVGDIESALVAFNEILAAHRQDVENLQEAVGAASRDDAQYRLREKWLKASSLAAAIAEDVAWEVAKSRAGAALNGLREGLIELRTEIVEDARRTFSEEMTEVWSLLREDSGASFSQLHVPPARGKGFKLEFELKAIISDGHAETEVDALRVFSESQVNAVGIAAYVTRADRLGHKLLIFDDPVQSMDEEHFRSFAANLLPVLIDEGHQVVILTHSNAFADCIHKHHFERESYATLTTRASKRKGCYVNEGSRRVSERLKVAEKAAEDGDLPRAWRMVRLAMERMYLLVKVRSDDGFKPESWRNHTAANMWDEGVGGIIEETVPSKSKRLKEILDSTAAGAHDKPATSETELKAAVKDLRALLAPLRLGAG